MFGSETNNPNISSHTGQASYFSFLKHSCGLRPTAMRGKGYFKHTWQASEPMSRQYSCWYNFFVQLKK